MENPPLKRYESEKPQAIFPCTIRMLLNNFQEADEGYSYEGIRQDLVEFATRIENMAEQAHSYEFTFTDCTGTIMGTIYKPSDTNAYSLRDFTYKKNAYYRVIGNIKINDSKQIQVKLISMISTASDLIAYRMKVAWNYANLTNMRIVPPHQNSGPARQSIAHSNRASEFMPRENPGIEREIFRILTQAEPRYQEEGMSEHQLYQGLTVKCPWAEFGNTLASLLLTNKIDTGIDPTKFKLK